MATDVLRPSPVRARPAILPWWIEPALTLVCYTAFVVYAFWSVVIGRSFFFAPYLSPFYSPQIGLVHIPFLSPALLVAWIPLGLRLTCYYYRKEYYRAFFRSPVACARAERPSALYTGERRFPLVLWNLHRYFLLLSIAVLIYLWIDVVRAFLFDGHVGIGLGSVAMLANVILLTGYTASCHSLRHLAGGRLDCYSCVLAGSTRHRLAELLTQLNASHGSLAWASMFSVALTDIYIKLLVAGVLHDPRWIT